MRPTATAMAAGAVALVALASTAPDAEPPAPAPAPPPASSPVSPGPGLVEKTGVALFLLDIEVHDQAGNPMRGLTPADFTVRRNGRIWPVATVDDFCTCEPVSPTGASIAGPGPAGATPRDTATAPAPDAVTPASAPGNDLTVPPAARPLVVIYFDFGQMRSDGRHLAVTAARRWVTTIRRPDDQVMIAGYVTRRGLLTLAEPTTDEARILRALDDAAENVAYSDIYALQLPDRLEECLRRDPTTCPTHAITEYDHSRRAVEALRLFMTHLGALPGPKTVLFFHENGFMETGPLYAQKDRRTNYERVEAVGAEATLARATIHPLVVSMDPLPGALGAQSTGFNATLAESTGGSYNRGPLDLDRAVTAATTGCRCRYVLGFEPPAGGSPSIASVSVTARGVRQRALYRVRMISEEDRFLRRASAVLENPGSATDIAVGAAIRPASAAAKRWDLAVEVAADARTMALLPRGATKQEGGWEVGARLQRLDTNAVWEMLATSAATTGAAGAPETLVVYRHDFTGLAAGRYRLSAFIRDRVAGVFGGGETFLDLPDPAKGGVAGPVMLVARAPRLMSPLPLTNDRARTQGVAAMSEPGPAPSPSIVLPRGATLRFESFVCQAPGGAPVEATARIERDDVTILRIDDPTRPPAAGGCAARVDEVTTAGLDAGRYLYVLVTRGPDGGPAPQAVPFVLAAPPASARSAR